jgi:hypothetical protein
VPLPAPGPPSTNTTATLLWSNIGSVNDNKHRRTITVARKYQAGFRADLSSDSALPNNNNNNNNNNSNNHHHARYPAATPANCQLSL